MPIFWRKLVHPSSGWKSKRVSRPVMKVKDTGKRGKETCHVASQITQVSFFFPFLVTVGNFLAWLTVLLEDGGSRFFRKDFTSLPDNMAKKEEFS